MKALNFFLLVCLVLVPHIAAGNDFDSQLSVGTTFNVDATDAPLMVGNYGNQNYLGSNPDCPCILGDHSYAVQAFSTAASGNHDMETVAPSSGVDTLIMLYSPSFDPSDPTANLITCDDDGGSAWPLSKITANLGAGVQYQVMVTTWNATPVDGTINWRILPDIVLIIATAVAAVPTLSEWGMITMFLVLGMAAFTYCAKNVRVPQPSSYIY